MYTTHRMPALCTRNVSFLYPKCTRQSGARRHHVPDLYSWCTQVVHMTRFHGPLAVEKPLRQARRACRPRITVRPVGATRLAAPESGAVIQQLSRKSWFQPRKQRIVEHKGCNTTDANFLPNPLTDGRDSVLQPAPFQRFYTPVCNTPHLPSNGVQTVSE